MDPKVLEAAKSWLAADAGSRSKYEDLLKSYQGSIDDVIQELRPHQWTDTSTGEHWDQYMTLPGLKEKYSQQVFHYYVPAHYTPDKPMGLIFWMHGGGTHDDAEYEWVKRNMIGWDGGKRCYARPETDESNYILVVPIAPFGDLLPNGLSNTASRWNVPSTDQYIMDLILEMNSRYNIDLNKVMVSGFSMGGTGAYHLAHRLTDRISAAFLSAGSWEIGSWRLMKYSSVFLHHGTDDESLNKYGYAQLADQIMTDLRIDHRFFSYVGNHAWTEYAETGWAEFVDGQNGWATSKIRDPYRSEVIAINPIRTYEIGNNYAVEWTEDPSPHTLWVSIDRYGAGTIPYDDSTGFVRGVRELNGGEAFAKIDAKNHILVNTLNVEELSLWLHPKMVDFSSPIEVEVNGVSKIYTCKESLLDSLRSYERRWDWNMIYSCELKLSDIPPPVQKDPSSPAGNGNVTGNASAPSKQGCASDESRGSVFLLIFSLTGLQMFRRSRKHALHVCMVAAVLFVSLSGNTFAATYYASPNGTGNGLSQGSPFKISDFWSVARPGDTLLMLDGRYVGDDSMITPPDNVDGASGNPIIVKAMNEGKVEIDGETQREPVRLDGNDWFVLEGFNAHSAGGATWSKNVLTLSYSNHNIVRRVVGWQARGDANVFRSTHGEYNLFEDCAAFGEARKLFSTSQGGNYTTFRRCWGMFQKSLNKGPKKVFSLSYNSYNNTCENCIGTWRSSMPESYELLETDGSHTGEMFHNYEVQAPEGIFSNDGFDVLPDIANIKMLGSISYIKAGDRFTNSTRNWAGPISFSNKGIEVVNSIAIVEPGDHDDIQGINLDGGESGINSAKNITAISAAGTYVASTWSLQDNYVSDSCSVLTANGGNILDPSIGGITTGATVMKRYMNGNLTNEPLWPWPMNQRIIEAMVSVGEKPVDVTREVFGLCGGTVPDFPGLPFPPDVDGNDLRDPSANPKVTGGCQAQAAIPNDLTLFCSISLLWFAQLKRKRLNVTNHR